MAPAKKRNVCSKTTSANAAKKAKIDPSLQVQQIIDSRKNANDVFDVLDCLQSEKEKEVISAINACCNLFVALLERKDLFIGKLIDEEAMLTGEHNAQDKYSMFMRHRYNDCVETLLEHLVHKSYGVKECALVALMKLAAAEGQYPLEDLDWSEHVSFPRTLILGVVGRLLSKAEDNTMLISRFTEYLEMVDVRYYTLVASLIPVYQNNVFTLVSSIIMPSQESELTNFMVKQKGLTPCSSTSQEHKRSFERMWLGFLKNKLPSNMYKKILVILHDSILPNMSNPTLMIDFLTAAYDVGGAISLLALNGLFILIHHHNLDYPDFYKKLYNLLEPSVFHVKYRARFFHLANLFLSSTHLPVYLVAAFAKRLARLALTAPPESLLMVLPFIYNLIRRHPSCRVLVHRPTTDPYLMDEEDPILSHALESSLWEIKTLQSHYHPDVTRVALKINKPLSVPEEDIDELLEITNFELMERDLKATKNVPLEFEPAKKLLQGGGGILGQHFCLE
uniref:CCAAT-binding factor domain-containing protein n=1 Tax=Gadus morhua TaxID=8049 RepID=A0A8C5ARY3_GADMO